MTVPKRNIKFTHEQTHCPMCNSWLYENLTEILGFCNNCFKWFKLAEYYKDGDYIRYDKPVDCDE